MRVILGYLFLLQLQCSTVNLWVQFHLTTQFMVLKNDLENKNQRTLAQDLKTHKPPLYTFHPYLLLDLCKNLNIN